MAKIIFWKSPIDPTQRQEFKTDRRILIEVLEDLEIEKDPLNILLNGENPDEISLDLELFDSDVLEIRKIVHGSSSNSKNTFATIISIVALVAATILTAGGAAWWAAGVTLAGGIASGALKYRAAKLALRGSGRSQSEMDVDANNFSLTSAQNEARPLQPLALPMGSVRSAPDFINEPYPSFYGGIVDSIIAKPVIEVNRPELTNPNDWTDILPAGFFAVTPYLWPPYDMKIEPSYNLVEITSMSATDRKRFAPEVLVGPFGSPAFPVILYHGDLADPYYGRVTNLATFANQRTRSSNLTQALIDYEYWFDITAVPTPSWKAALEVDLLYLLYFVWGTSYTTLGSIIPYNWWFSGGSANYFEVINLYLSFELNQDSSWPITSIGNIRFATKLLGYSYEYSPQLAATHIFNFGLGDLAISDERVEKTLRSDILNSESVIINKSSWQMPSTFKSFYHRNTKNLEGATLNNNEDVSGPDVYIQPTDQNKYNFIYRVTPKKCGLVKILFQGNLYNLSDTGLKENKVTFEIQYRAIGETLWAYSEYVFIFNDDTLIFRQDAIINLSYLPGDDFEFRIRKVDLDENNNSGKFVAQFDIVAFQCFQDLNAYDVIGQEIHGLYLVANTQTSGSSNKYSAQVDSKCWVYDSMLDAWTWDFTRNPAWWFLYFARGGFKNPPADGTYTYPWSPTFGWVNGTGHPNSTEFLFGCGMSDNLIDIETIKVWAEFCDDQQLYIDIVMKDSVTEIEILEKIANTGRGSVSYYKGLLSVVYEDSQQIPVGLYGMGNIIEGSFAADYSVTNLPSKVIGNYIDRENDWEQKEVEALVPFANSDDLNFITLSLDGITTTSQAQREVNILAARQFFQKRTYTWKVDKEGLVAKRGDLVYLSHDSTQFSYSGRVLKFIVDLGLVVGIETTAEIIDNDINFVTIRLPNGTLKNYSCTVDKCVISFVDAFLIEDAPYYLLGNNDQLNVDSDFSNSYPEDYIFIAGPLSTTGKVVRISQIQPDEKMNFTITAIDEDPAMWSYEYGPVIDSESFDDSLILSRVYNVSYKQLGDGKIKLFWETEGTDFIKIYNVDTGFLISADGMLSFSRGEVTLELISGGKYNLRLEPFVIGSAYKQENKVIVVWA